MWALFPDQPKYSYFLSIHSSYSFFFLSKCTYKYTNVLVSLFINHQNFHVFTSHFQMQEHFGMISISTLNTHKRYFMSTLFRHSLSKLIIHKQGKLMSKYSHSELLQKLLWVWCFSKADAGAALPSNDWLAWTIPQQNHSRLYTQSWRRLQRPF